MSIRRKYDINRNTGFTLIEVLVAVVVLAFGLLGLAGLQTITLRNNQSAYYRSQATQLAYDMADRIRANSSDADNLAASTYVTINPNAASAQADCATVSTTCIASDMAKNDLYLWYQDLTTNLPLGAGSIAVNAATQVFTITVSWDDTRSGNANTSFQMSFQP